MNRSVMLIRSCYGTVDIKSPVVRNVERSGECNRQWSLLSKCHMQPFSFLPWQSACSALYSTYHAVTPYKALQGHVPLTCLRKVQGTDDMKFNASVKLVYIYIPCNLQCKGTFTGRTHTLQLYRLNRYSL